jgi:hypothetical protein
MFIQLLKDCIITEYMHRSLHQLLPFFHYVQILLQLFLSVQVLLQLFHLLNHHLILIMFISHQILGPTQMMMMLQIYLIRLAVKRNSRQELTCLKLIHKWRVQKKVSKL